MNNFAFKNFSDFIYMNGHGVYVWLVYGTSIVLLCIFLWITKQKIKKLLLKIKNAEN